MAMRDVVFTKAFAAIPASTVASRGPATVAKALSVTLWPLIEQADFNRSFALSDVASD
jgi:hypothetical protein